MNKTLKNTYLGPIGLWKICPLFQGTAFTIILVTYYRPKLLSNKIKINEK